MEDSKILSEILAAVLSQNGEIRQLSDRIDRLDEHFVNLEDRFSSLEDRFSSFEDRFSSFEDRFNSFEDRFRSFEDRFNSLEKSVDELKSITDKLSIKATNIEITLENDVTPSIMRVAEGHIDFNRRLEKTNNTENILSANLEMYDLYIRHHESEIKKLKNACNIA